MYGNRDYSNDMGLSGQIRLRVHPGREKAAKLGRYFMWFVPIVVIALGIAFGYNSLMIFAYAGLVFLLFYCMRRKDKKKIAVPANP